MAAVAIPNVSIGSVLPGDLGMVTGLERLCFKDPYPSHFIAQLKQENPDTFLVAAVEGDLVGYAVVNRGSDHDHLVSIAVHPAWRNRGIGTRLILALEERLGERRPFRLEVRKGNLRAIKFYRGTGFNEIGFVDRYYADGEDAVLMEKPSPP